MSTASESFHGIQPTQFPEVSKTNLPFRNAIQFPDESNRYWTSIGRRSFRLSCGHFKYPQNQTDGLTTNQALLNTQAYLAHRACVAIVTRLHRSFLRSCGVAAM